MSWIVPGRHQKSWKSSSALGEEWRKPKVKIFANFSHLSWRRLSNLLFGVLACQSALTSHWETFWESLALKRQWCCRVSQPRLKISDAGGREDPRDHMIELNIFDYKRLSQTYWTALQVAVLRGKALALPKLGKLFISETTVFFNTAYWRVRYLIYTPVAYSFAYLNHDIICR